MDKRAAGNKKMREYDVRSAMMDEMMRGEIFLDPTDGLWKVLPRQNEHETRTAAAFGERDKSPHGARSQVALA